MSIEVTRGFKIFPFGHTISVAYETTLMVGELSRIIDDLAQDILKPLLNAPQLLNLKGSDLSETRLTKAIEFAPTKDELIFISGYCFANNHDDIVPQKEIGKSSFKLTLSTDFMDFPDTGGIRYVTRERRSSNLPAVVKWDEIGRAFPLMINYFRFGLEFFHMKSSLLGLVPDTNEKISLESTEGRLSFSFQAEALKNKTVWPERSLSILQKFERILGVALTSQSQ